ncbi:MAG: hypothetical protein EPO68_07440 [Planctomycetota bacterium]|nr:MAG: hypothetical protein EPO68_07440 [Planctomycetota bacterium]
MPLGNQMLALCLTLAFVQAPEVVAPASRPSTAIAELDATAPTVALIEALARASGVPTPEQSLRHERALGLLRDRILRGEPLTNDQWLHVLERTGSLRHRAKWPATTPFSIRLGEPYWIDPEAEIRLLPKQPSWNSAHSSVPQSCLGSSEWLYTKPLGEIALGAQSVAYRVYVVIPPNERAHEVPAVEPRVLGGGTLGEFDVHFDVEGVCDVDEVVPPVASPEIATALREALVVFADVSTVPARVDVMLDLGRTQRAGLHGIGSSFETRIVDNGKVRDTWRKYTMLDGTSRQNVGLLEDGRPVVPLIDTLVPTAVWTSADARKGWSLELRGTSKDVLSLWTAERRWSGELVLTLDELHQLAQREAAK